MTRMPFKCAKKVLIETYSENEGRVSDSKECKFDLSNVSVLGGQKNAHGSENKKGDEVERWQKDSEVIRGNALGTSHCKYESKLLAAVVSSK